MKDKLVIIYSPLCEANGSFIEKLKQWVKGSGCDAEIEVYAFDSAPSIYRQQLPACENCFIDVLLNGKRIDTIPLHKELILKALHKSEKVQDILQNETFDNDDSDADVKLELLQKDICFHAITEDNYMQEMQMCLKNYPRGNPPVAHHSKCIDIKKSVFSEIWKIETVAGIYAEYKGAVIGLIEVLPREMVKKYGYLTGTQGSDYEVLTVTCYEVACNIPRTIMLDALMSNLLKIKGKFSRRRLEGIGVLGCVDGFNPCWVYEAHGFSKTECLNENTFVWETAI